MHSRNRYFGSKGVSVCQCTVGLIKINTLNMRTPIFKVMCNKCPCIKTVAFLNTWINEWTDDLCVFKQVFDWYGIQKKDEIFFLSHCTNKDYLQNYLWGPFKASPMLFGVRGISGRCTSLCETTGMAWTNMEQISSIYVLW